MPSTAGGPKRSRGRPRRLHSPVMAIPARCGRAEKLRIDRALGRIYSAAKDEESYFDSFHRIHLHVARNTSLLRPIPRPPGEDPVTALRNIARFHDRFLRPVETWQPSNGSTLSSVGSLATHLLGHYKLPTFLASTWFGPQRERELCRRNWFVRHSRGESFRKTIHPRSMSRREESFFLLSPDHLRIDAAMCRSQVLALGGSPHLADAILKTRLSSNACTGRFWKSVLIFLINHEQELTHETLPFLIDGLHYLHTACLEISTDSATRKEVKCISGFSLKGRSVRSVLRLLESNYGDPRNSWRRSGLRELVVETANGISDLPKRWWVTELCDAKRLRAEGRAMGNCVGSYLKACRQGHASIWSIRRWNDSGVSIPVLTIEIDLKARDVIQARGRFNATPSKDALKVLDRWIERENLSKSLWVNNLY